MLNVEEESMFGRHAYDFITNLLQIASSTHEQFVVCELWTIVASDVMDVLGLALTHEYHRWKEVNTRHHLQTVHDSASQVVASCILGLVDVHLDDVTGHNPKSFAEKSGHDYVDDLLVWWYFGCI